MGVLVVGMVCAANAASTAQQTFDAVKDTYVDETLPDTAFGTTTNVLKFNPNYGTPGTRRELSVDFGDVVENLPAGARIYYARMILTQKSSSGTPNFARIFHRNNTWNETNATWNTGQPTDIGTYRPERIGWSPSDTTVIMDVTPHLDKVVRAGSGSAAFGLDGGGGGNDVTAEFYSREDGTASNRPSLIVDYYAADAEVVRLQYGLNSYTGTVDTYVSNRSGHSNTTHDTSADFYFMENDWVGYYGRALVKFDVHDALPSSPVPAILVSATLALSPYDYQDNDNVSVTAREALKDWTGGGATYDKYDGVNDWETPGGYGATDQSDVVASTNLTGTGSGMIFLDVTSSVSNLLNNPSTNFGWFVGISGTCVNIIKLIATADHGTAVFRPQLWLEYRIPPGTIFYSY